MDINSIILYTVIIFYFGCGLGLCMFLGGIGCKLKFKVIMYCIFIAPIKSFYQSWISLPEVAHKIVYNYYIENKE